jgi:hypothetical protein
MENEKRIIEINGVKLEIDMRNAKRVDTFKIGDAVKVLDMNYQEHKIFPGVIVDFAEFKSSPAIEVMVLCEGYSDVEFKFITISSKTEKYEIVHYNQYEKLFTKSNVIDRFDKLIEKHKVEIEELERKKKYFINDFQKAFESIL